jgi:HlyD family secretion protein
MLKYFKLLIPLVIVAAVGLFGWWYLDAREGHTQKFRTVAARRGELSATINATGTIEPEEVIDIGAQVAGMIKEFGTDPKNPNKSIDYGSEVEKGTVLAKIDESLYKAAVDQTEANLHQAEANVQKAKADLVSVKSKREQTQRDWLRAQQLWPSRAIADVDYDTAKNAWEAAQAAVPGGQAAVEAAEKAVEVARAQNQTAQINLAYCTIKSPVKGVIVDRRVNIGQTVVSSLSAPSLFLLAKDLKRLQVWASVNEADIGHIYVGLPVSFSVDAYPGEKFQGKVAQIRLNATMVQNVVTYTVVVSADNSSGRLLPYMTANLDFEIDRHPDALRVPNAALRWQPTPQEVAPDARAEFMKALRAQSGASGSQPQTAKKDSHDRGRVWVVDRDFVRPIKVRIGLSDGAMTEIVGGDLKEETPVVVGEVHENNAAGTSNPFTPQMFRQKGQQ